jgi:hypothetical protein
MGFMRLKNLLLRLKILFAYAAEGALVIIGKILEGYAVVLLRVIDKAAYAANILHIPFLLYLVLIM